MDPWPLHNGVVIGGRGRAGERCSGDFRGREVTSGRAEALRVGGPGVITLEAVTRVYSDMCEPEEGVRGAVERVTRGVHQVRMVRGSLSQEVDGQGPPWPPPPGQPGIFGYRACCLKGFDSPGGVGPGSPAPGVTVLKTFTTWIKVLSCCFHWGVSNCYPQGTVFPSVCDLCVSLTDFMFFKSFFPVVLTVY